MPQEENVEIQSPRSNATRVESEETQDHVRETLAISQEEVEEMGFVPSALGEPGSQSPDLGDMWRHGCPMSPEWVSSCSTSETSFGGEEYEHNNESGPLKSLGRIGQGVFLSCKSESEKTEGC